VSYVVLRAVAADADALKKVTEAASLANKNIVGDANS
jgi:hypothetical protein